MALAVERPMPGRAASASGVRGNAPPCVAMTILRAAVQVAGAGVVAEPAPQFHHRLDRRGGQIGQRREALEEAP